MQVVDRIYPNIAIHAQASGRHSTTDPPLAQLPPILHDILEPDPGEFWIGGDFSGQEVWIGAAESNDTLLLNQLQQGWDSHTLALCDGLGWSYPKFRDEPTKDTEWLHRCGLSKTSFARWRRWFKACRLSLSYGKKPQFVYLIPGSLQLGITPAKGEQIARRYLAKHPALEPYWERLENQINKHGIVKSFTGRRRILYDKGDKRKREGFNGPMQQGGTDILNLTICRVCNAFPESRYVYGVHDSFWFSFPKMWGKLVSTRPITFLEMQKEAQEEENNVKVSKVQKIVMEPFMINGHECSIPVDWKFRGL